jgi:hypothetical protein
MMNEGNWNGMLAGMDWGDPEGFEKTERDSDYYDEEACETREMEDEDKARKLTTCNQCAEDVSTQFHSVGRERSWKCKLEWGGHFQETVRTVYCRECQELDGGWLKDITEHESASTSQI